MKSLPIAVLAAGALYLAVVHSQGLAQETSKKPAGKIYLVGMGPGDPDLMTLRAAQVIRSADKVFCSSGTGQQVKPMARPDAVEEVPHVPKRLYGKRRSPALPEGERAKGGQTRDAESQEAEKNRQETTKRFEAFAVRVRRLVADGKTVAILDGGDPLIFGGLAWVTEEFQDLPLEVVPGVSCFNAANAALKRDIMWGGKRCAVLSGGDVLGVPPQDGRMVSPTVFFTHRAPIRELIPRLLERYPADTPVAVVSHAGCRDKQQVLQATLETVLNRLGEGAPAHPYLLYVGDILTLKHTR